MWRCGSFDFEITKPLIMGILNVTPDSFSDGGTHNSLEAAIAHAHRLVEEGADIIDVGGESTRPGSDEVSIEEELARVLPAVKQLAEEGIPISIDTRHAKVAAACVTAGAAIVNDVSGFRDPAMVEVAAAPDCSAGLVIMHMLGEPKTMQSAEPQYDNVVLEVSTYLLNRARELETAGISRDRICIDPGPGFGKTVEHNLELLRATHEMSILGYPLMAAYSRKTFLGKLTGVEEPSERIASSVTVAVFAATQGAHILRVHDVAPTVEALTVLRNLYD
jgi:dihydropteroate synthase